jgi:hypothetical protein
LIFFAKIEDVFKITGRGFVAQSAFPEEGLRIRVGDPIQLRTPDGRVLETHLAGISHLRPLKPLPKRFNWGFSFPPEIRFEDVVVGTEIWIALGE